MKWKPTICIECGKTIYKKQLRKKVRSELMYKDCFVHLACFKGKSYTQDSLLYTHIGV